MSKYAWFPGSKNIEDYENSGELSEVIEEANELKGDEDLKALFDKHRTGQVVDGWSVIVIEDPEVAVELGQDTG